VKDNTPQEIKDLAEHLIQAAHKHRATIIGFIWDANDDKPYFMRFGNTKERGPALRNVLHSLADISLKKEAAGLVAAQKVGEVN
jgi:hypothetical protein